MVNDTGRNGAHGLLFPVGHYLGIQHRPDNSVVQQIRRGGVFHDLTDKQVSIWTLAHGTPDAAENEAPWHRAAVESVARASGIDDAPDTIDQLIGLGLLVEVERGTNGELDFANNHRLVPLMLGLGSVPDEPGLFGIGFLNQPILQVTHPIYDLWQWSTMDDSLWATCEGAADAARRGGITDESATDPAQLLTGFVGALHGLLLARAAYLDPPFHLAWPDSSPEPATIGDENG